MIIKSKKGFSSDKFDKGLQHAICSYAGKRGHKMKRAHEWTKKEASEAGKRGGRFTKRERVLKTNLYIRGFYDPYEALTLAILTGDGRG